MRKALCLMLLIIAGITASCAQNAPSIEASPEPPPQPSPIHDVLPPAPIVNGAPAQPLRIVFQATSTMDQTPYSQYAEALLKSEGIHVQFEVYPIRTNDYNYYLQAYEQYARDNLENNTVMIVNQGIAERVTSEEKCRDMFSEGMFLAPEYTSKYAAINNPADTMKFAPVNILTPPLRRPAVLVRNEIYERYGIDVRTASDYHELLTRIKADQPDLVPGAASPLINDTVMNNFPGFTALEVFLPEWGYAPSPYTGLAMYAVLGEESMVPATTLRECESAYKQFMAWNADGLMDFWNAGTWRAKLSFRLEDYPTILLNTNDISSNFQHWEFFHPLIKDLNLEDYRMFILYRDTLPQFTNASYVYTDFFGITGENTDPTEFLELMEWLEDPAHYRLFMNGEEGVEYEVDANERIVPLDSGIQYHKWNQSIVFAREHLETAQLGNMPVNYYEEIGAVYYPYAVVKNMDSLKDFERKLYDSPYIDMYGKFWGEFRDFHATLYRHSLGRVNAEAEKQIDDFIIRQRSDDDWDKLVAMMDETLDLTR